MSYSPENVELGKEIWWWRIKRNFSALTRQLWKVVCIVPMTVDDLFLSIDKPN